MGEDHRADLSGGDEDILAAFGDEAAENLDVVEAALDALTAGRGEDAPGEAFRAAHTLKGNALSLGLTTLGGLAHEVEELLARVGTGTATSEQLALGLGATAAMRVALARGLAGDDRATPELVEGRLALAQALLRGPAEPDESSASAETAPRVLGRSLRVDIAVLERLLELLGELATARGRERHALAAAPAGSERLLALHGDTDRVVTALRDLVLEARLVPLAPLFRRSGHVVREAAATLGKRAALHVDAGHVAVDTTVVEPLHDALVHLLRNAVDHGIEPAEERISRGKSPEGNITIRAEQSATGVQIEVADDGPGLDLARIAAHAGRPPEALDASAAAELITRPGFSTRDEVTALSGRGVGLDVVRHRVAALRGSLSIASTPGQGTRFTLRVPTTLAVLSGLYVVVGGRTSVLPLETVVECFDLGARPAGDEGVLVHRGRALPFLRLRALFGEAGPLPQRECVVVVRDGGARLGLVVDELSGEAPTVLEPRGFAFGAGSLWSGSTVLGDGSVALVLDVGGILARWARDTRADAPLSQGGIPWASSIG